MLTTRSRAAIIKKALADWKNEGLLEPAKVEELTKSINVVAFNYKKLAKWAFVTACLCFAAAVFSLIGNRFIIELLAIIAQLPLGRFVFAVAAAAVMFGVAITLSRREPGRVFRNEALMTLAVFLTAWAVAELGLMLNTGSGHYSLLLLLACGIYFGVGWVAKSPTVWLFALLSLGGWFGAETAYQMGAYFLGMNQPLRFVAFGGVLTAGALCLQGRSAFRPFFKITLIMGQLYLFVALWILSIWGSRATWYYARSRADLLVWSVLFAAVSFLMIWLGLKKDLKLLRGFGLTFLFINLYTRFFEYFWAPMDKSIFFGLLGVSLWLLARRAEKIWMLTEKRWGKLLENDED